MSESFAITYDQILDHMLTLKEAVDDDARDVHFYHYPPHKALALLRITEDWSATINRSAFPSANPEIEAGVDCYALERNTACVFHMMRVAELGMRALARERQVSFPKHPLEWADWQNILEQTESRAKAATSRMPRGPAKDAALAFYSGALGQLHAFKDTYRNVVMHVRRTYDELDALRAINQVRDFMNGLSPRRSARRRAARFGSGLRRRALGLFGDLPEYALEIGTWLLSPNFARHFDEAL
jgi:hypothetical protein